MSRNKRSCIQAKLDQLNGECQTTQDLLQQLSENAKSYGDHLLRNEDELQSRSTREILEVFDDFYYSLLDVNILLSEALVKMEPVKGSVKMPPFCRNNVAVWIAQAEAQFHISGVTVDSEKYNCIVGGLDQEALECVSDIVLSPPAGNMYDTLKNALVEGLKASEEKSLSELLNGLSLGEMKPSKLLLQMKQLAGCRLQESPILRSLWFQQLPQQAQAILSASPEQPLDQQAVTADRIVEVCQESPLYGVESSTVSISRDPILSLVEEVLKQIEEMRKEIKILGTKMQRQGRSSSRGRSDNNYWSSSRSDDVCFFHKVYGSNARKCRQPCQMAEDFHGF